MREFSSTALWRNSNRLEVIGQSSKVHQSGLRQDPACLDLCKEHMERGCWEQWILELAWQNDGTSAYAFKVDTFGAGRRELAEYKGEQTGRQGRGSWHLQRKGHPPDIMILLLGRLLAAMQALRCGWLARERLTRENKIGIQFPRGEYKPTSSLEFNAFLKTCWAVDVQIVEAYRPFILNEKDNKNNTFISFFKAQTLSHNVTKQPYCSPLRISAQINHEYFNSSSLLFMHRKMHVQWMRTKLW